MIEWWGFKWWECEWCCCSEWFGHSVCHATGSPAQRPVSQLQGILDGHSILLDMALMPNVIFDCQLKNRIWALDRDVGGLAPLSVFVLLWHWCLKSFSIASWKTELGLWTEMLVGLLHCQYPSCYGIDDSSQFRLPIDKLNWGSGQKQ